jgi:hypothetical protein
VGDQSFSSAQGQQEWLIQQNVSATANAQIKRVQLRMFAADGEFSGSLVGYVNND